MIVILTEFKALSKYCDYYRNRVVKQEFKTSSEEDKKFSDKPEHCPHCQHPIIHPHGHYKRKADREHRWNTDSLNPVVILRYRCGSCRRTFSALPECIPPRQWYLWEIQEQVLKANIAGDSKNAISQKVLPSRRTIGRWLSRFTEIWQNLQHHFKACWTELGNVANTFTEFWQALLQKTSLASTMHYLYDCGERIP
jgi:transposase-like protein